MAQVKFPQVKVQLTGLDGNAFMIIGRVRRAMKEKHIAPEAIEEFTSTAMSGNYDNVLQTCMAWVNVK